MQFREATDSLCSKVSHEDIAKALGVSVQSVRQARLPTKLDAHRSPPNRWERGLLLLAKARIDHYRSLIERLQTDSRRESNS